MNPNITRINDPTRTVMFGLDRVGFKTGRIEFGSVRVNSGQFGSVRVNSGQFGSVEIGSIRVKLG